jgi:uncharacterized protein involved in type VI secretion and phage assembly
MQDSIRILFCDFEMNVENDEELGEIVAYLEMVKDFLTRMLEEEEIWIVFYPLLRIAS